MKRIICLITALCLVLCSFSFCFAAVQDVSDATTHTQLGNLYNLLNGTNFSGRLATISNKLVDINNNLVTLMGWLDPSTGGSTTALLNQILNALTYTDAGGLVKSWLVDIQGYNYQESAYLYDLKQLDNVIGTEPFNGASSRVNLPLINSSGNLQTLALATGNQNWRQNFFVWLKYLNDTVAYSSNFLLAGFNSTQTFTNWTDLTSDTFTPSSQTNGIYNWLSKLQTPAARLAYVLASDERIAAQEAAAANEEAVVDNFIDSSGDGAASPSDIGSVSDLSSGYKQNFGSDASVSDIFNIFDSNNMGWFSQETKNQLDTTTPTRLTKGSESETPLLDKQIEDIYDALGVKQQ